MGQKVHPKAFRIGVIRDWDAKWFAGKKEFTGLLNEDMQIRRLIEERFRQAGISRIEIERAANRVKLTIHTGKPGMVIGKGGTGVESLRKQLEAMTGKSFNINIVEVKTPELDAKLVAESIASQLERRIGFRRAMKQAANRTMRMGAKGVKIIVSGRLGGAEMSRREKTIEGTVPLHTLRADIDFGQAEAFTTYGQLGVKVWICKGLAPARKAEARPEAAGEAAPPQAAAPEAAEAAEAVTAG